MRKYAHLAAVAASAAIVALPMTSADAAVTHVLTIRKVGGPAVKPGAVLKAGLVKGTTAVFSLGTTRKLTCKSAGFSATVRSNPAKPGKATASFTAQHFAKCTVTGIPGVAFKSLKAKNLPYKATVSDAKGHPVTISGQSKSEPLKFTVTVLSKTATVSCTYKAASITGHAITGNAVRFTRQKFTKSSGECPGSALFFSATFGPVRDTSVTNSPKVFVN